MIEYSTHTLANGLHIIHHFDGTTPMVAVDVLYNVGARDESPRLTGMAHLFEHLMFGGSVNVPEFDKAIEAAGGWNNAWTSNDFTNFYDVLPASNVETAFWLESDRMLELAFSERSLQVQRSVVIEEFKQTCLNRPYGDLMHHLRSLLYTVHPYRYPTIGKEISHIEAVTLEDIKEFFFSHYAPNNAVLAVSGNVPFDRTIELAEKWFGGIPSRAIAPRDYPAEPPITQPRRAVHGARAIPQTTVTIAFPMAAYGEPGYIPADIITDILASGRSARFYQNLVMANPLFTSADASIVGSEEPGFLMLNAAVSVNDIDHADQAARIMLSEASRLAVDGCSDYELERAVNRYESNATFSAMGYLPKAQLLALACMHGKDINDEVAAYRAVTPEDIRTVAAEIFNPSRSATLIYHPQA